MCICCLTVTHDLASQENIEKMVGRATHNPRKEHKSEMLTWPDEVLLETYSSGLLRLLAALGATPCNSTGRR